MKKYLKMWFYATMAIAVVGLFTACGDSGFEGEQQGEQQEELQELGPDFASQLLGTWEYYLGRESDPLRYNDWYYWNMGEIGDQIEQYFFERIR